MKKQGTGGRAVHLALGAFALWVVPQTGSAVPPSSVVYARRAQFADFLQSLWPLAATAGVRRETFDHAIGDLELDPTAPRPSTEQAEFDKPLNAYLTSAVTARRIAQGKDLRRRWGDVLAAIEKRYGVPHQILVSAYGVETDYGTAAGGKDIIRSLATLAYMRSDRSMFRDELVAALVILDSGAAPREKLRGSWAGAMGGPQFLPSAYLKYAVAYDGSGFADIWDKPQDIFASIANFLRASGWKPNLPWGLEVRLPEGFGFPFLHGDFAAFSGRGVRAADGAPLPHHGEATLFLPSGGRGPAFLLADNYWVLKAYNNSDSYALSLGHLADRIEGGPGVRARWPEREPMLSRSEKAEMQGLLAQRGLYKGTIDGRFGQASRDAIHAFQKSVGLDPADGYGSPEILRRLREGAGGSAQ
jgi:membrane-bound lytic murein transglycosylase B